VLRLVDLQTGRPLLASVDFLANGNTTLLTVVRPIEEHFSDGTGAVCQALLSLFMLVESSFDSRRRLSAFA
jgi:hypothetical protein